MTAETVWIGGGTVFVAASLRSAALRFSARRLPLAATFSAGRHVTGRARACRSRRPRFRRRSCSDPARALANGLGKDRTYADRIAARSRKLGFPVLVDGGSRPLVDPAEAVIDIPHGYVDLCAARRWENEAAAANMRAWLSSPAEYESGAVRSAH